MDLTALILDTKDIQWLVDVLISAVAKEIITEQSVAEFFARCESADRKDKYLYIKEGL